MYHERKGQQRNKKSGNAQIATQGHSKVNLSQTGDETGFQGYASHGVRSKMNNKSEDQVQVHEHGYKQNHNGNKIHKKKESQSHKAHNSSSNIAANGRSYVNGK